MAAKIIVLDVYSDSAHLPARYLGVECMLAHTVYILVDI